jgi:hypothetical protein
MKTIFLVKRLPYIVPKAGREGAADRGPALGESAGLSPDQTLFQREPWSQREVLAIRLPVRSWLRGHGRPVQAMAPRPWQTVFRLGKRHRGLYRWSLKTWSWLRGHGWPEAGRPTRPAPTDSKMEWACRNMGSVK